jgi:hypothetical protein
LICASSILFYRFPFSSIVIKPVWFIVLSYTVFSYISLQSLVSSFMVHVTVLGTRCDFFCNWYLFRQFLWLFHILFIVISTPNYISLLFFLVFLNWYSHQQSLLFLFSLPISAIYCFSFPINVDHRYYIYSVNRFCEWWYFPTQIGKIRVFYPSMDYSLVGA